MKCKTEKKKTVLTALLAFLMVFATLPMQSVHAQSMTISLSPDHSPIGIQVVVSGTLESYGAQFKVFWDYVKDWDGKAGFMGSGYAEGNKFSITITVPPVLASEHYVIVEDEKNLKTVAAIFNVQPEIAVNPNRGPVGYHVAVSGRLVANETFTIAFAKNGSLMNVAETHTNSQGYFTVSVIVPNMAPGPYMIVAYYSGPQAQTLFEITPPPSMTVNPTQGLPGDNVTLTGTNFAPNAGVIVCFDNLTIASAKTGENGDFTANFNAPNVPAATYTIRAVDSAYNQTASTSFTVHSTVIRPRASIYLQGDLISFYVNSTLEFESGSTITMVIEDPAGCLFTAWSINASALIKVGNVWTAPYVVATLSPPIPSDAVTGVWMWTATYRVGFHLQEDRRAGGTFEVAVKPTLKMVLDNLNELDVKIEGILKKSDDIYLLIGTSKGEVLAKLNDVNATLTGIIVTAKGEVLTKIDTALGSINLELKQLNATITDLRGRIVTIQTDLGKIEVDTDVIGARITEIEGLNVTITTLLGELKGTIDTIDRTTTNMNRTIVNVVVPDLGNMWLKLADVESAASGADTAASRASSAITSVTIMLYIVVALAVASVVISAATFIQTRRRTD